MSDPVERAGKAIRDTFESLTAERDRLRLRNSELDHIVELAHAENDRLREQLHKLNIAAAKYRAATDHHLGWTPEHPHLKPLIAAMLDARAALAKEAGK